MSSSQPKSLAAKHAAPKLVREVYGDAPYEYYPLGKYVVSAPDVCGGRPTFKYTRLEVSVILGLVASGTSVPEVVQRYAKSRLSQTAVREAIHLASQTLEASALALQPA